MTTYGKKTGEIYNVFLNSLDCTSFTANAAGTSITYNFTVDWQKAFKNTTYNPNQSKFLVTHQFFANYLRYWVYSGGAIPPTTYPENAAWSTWEIYINFGLASYSSDQSTSAINYICCEYTYGAGPAVLGATEVCGTPNNVCQEKQFVVNGIENNRNFSITISNRAGFQLYTGVTNGDMCSGSHMFTFERLN